MIVLKIPLVKIVKDHFLWSDYRSCSYYGNCVGFHLFYYNNYYNNSVCFKSLRYIEGPMWGLVVNKRYRLYEYP